MEVPGREELVKDDGYGVMSVLKSLKSGGVEEGKGSEWRQFQNLGEDGDGFSLGVCHCDGMILSGGSIDAEAWNSCEMVVSRSVRFDFT